MSTELGTLLLDTVSAIVAVALQVLPGAVLFNLRTVGDATVRALSRVSFVLFLPCLLFAAVPPVAEEMAPIGILCLFVLLIFLVAAGWCTGAAARRVFGLRSSLAFPVKLLCAFHNAGSLPLALWHFLVPLEGTGGVIEARKHRDLGIAYIGIYIVLSNAVLRGWGQSLAMERRQGSTTELTMPSDGEEETDALSVASDEWDNKSEVPADMGRGSGVKRVVRRFGLEVVKNLTIPAVTLVVAVLIGLQPQTYSVLFDSSSRFYVVVSIAKTLGSAVVPVQMLVLGASLMRISKRTSSLSFATLFTLVAAKLVVIPSVVGVGLVLLHRAVPTLDKAILLVLFLQSGMPSAVTLFYGNFMPISAQCDLAASTLAMHICSVVTVPVACVTFLYFL